MRTLPAQGGSSGTWGTELNDFLSVVHEPATGHLSLVAYTPVVDNAPSGMDIVFYEYQVVAEYDVTYQ